MIERLDRDSKHPLYIQVRESIRKGLAEGNRDVDESLPSELVLAEQYGVSRITVRNAILDLVNEGLLYRVPGKGTFVANGVDMEDVRMSRASFLKLIGFVVPYAQGYTPDVITGIEKVAKRKGYHVLFKNSYGSVCEEKSNITSLVNDGVDGIIIWPTIEKEKTKPNEVFTVLRQKNIPFVLIDRTFDSFHADVVKSDNFGGSYLSVVHLLSLGYSNIGFVSGDRGYLSSVRERINGYRQALLSNTYSFDDSLVFLEWTPDEPCMLDHFFDWLDKKQIHAVLVDCDSLAIEIIQALHEKGLKVPDDLAVVGFDDIQEARTFEVPLTTVRQLKEQIGATAAWLLIRRMEAKGRFVPEEIVLPTSLIVRESCGGQNAALNQCRNGHKQVSF